MSEPDVSGLLSVTEAIAILDAAKVTPRVVEISLEKAQGLRLAEAIRADRDYPPFDKSLMDGYAVRCGDVAQAPASLRVVGEVAAGQQSERALQPGEAMAIMTGAPMPAGADGVVPVEDTTSVSDARLVTVNRSTSPGRFIARRGSDCQAGRAVLPVGARLESAALAVAASVGAARVKVFARPSVAVLSTGDELVGIDQSPRGSQIRNSNNVMLVALLGRLGCDVRDLGTASDDREKIRAAMTDGLARADVLFVTGGMSMGQYDWCPKVMREMGADLKITKLKIKPGKPFVFGMLRSKFIFGLPGNPVSGFVCTLRLCSRLLSRIAGGEPSEKWLTGILDTPLAANGPREFYQPARYNAGRVQALAWKGSADLYTLAAADALLVRAENEPALPAGATVKVLEIPT